MNDAHLHMVFNHFPIIGTIFAIGILIAGLVLKNNAIKNIGYYLFIVTAVFGFLSMSTGEGAEEIVEDFPEIGKKIIHEHEELAEKLALVLYLLAGLSIVALYLDFKKNSKEKIVSYFILIVGLISLFLGQKTGTSGGEIRHTEIRSESSATKTSNENSLEKNNNNNEGQ